MYYHPLILTEAQRQQRLAPMQDFARLRLDGIDHQRQMHTDAVAEFCEEGAAESGDALRGRRHCALFRALVGVCRCGAAVDVATVE